MNIKDYCNGVQHVGLPTLDMQATLNYYQALGFSVAFETVNDGSRVAFLRLKNLTIEAYESCDAAKCVGAIAHVALDVSDVSAVYELVKRAGFHMLDSEVRFLPFWEKGTRFFSIEGPNKEIIEFSQIL